MVAMFGKGDNTEFLTSDKRIVMVQTEQRCTWLAARHPTCCHAAVSQKACVLNKAVWILPLCRRQSLRKKKKSEKGWMIALCILNLVWIWRFNTVAKCNILPMVGSSYSGLELSSILIAFWLRTRAPRPGSSIPALLSISYGFWLHILFICASTWASIKYDYQ